MSTTLTDSEAGCGGGGGSASNAASSPQGANSNDARDNLYQYQPQGRAPIASMDAMEDMDMLSDNNTNISKMSSDNITVATNGKQALAMGIGMGVSTSLAGIGNSAAGVKYRHIGKSGLKVSNVSLGSMKLFSHENPEVAEDIISAAYELGVNFFDASDPYQQDRTESEFGRIFKKKNWRRRDYVVMTKVYWSKNEEKSLSRKEILESVKQSLKNLDLDYIDLVLVNKYDTNCPTEEVVRAMTYLVNTGQIMYWGTSRWTPTEIFDAYSISKAIIGVAPVCELGEYHPFHREKIEVYMAELYNKVGIGLMTWSPVGYGLCAGGRQEDMQDLVAKLYMKSAKYCKMVEQGSSMNETNDPQSKVKELSRLAERYGCTLTQLIVAWCLRNQTSQSHVISAATVDQFQDILMSLTMISKLNMEEIERVLDNKPSRPPMISTLQQRWANNTGLPPC